MLHTNEGSLPAGAQGGSSTAALLRAAKAKQQLQHKKLSALEAAAPRSASVPKKGSGAEAKKLVYTLHSPSMETDAPASAKQTQNNKLASQGHARPQSQPPPAVGSTAAVLDNSDDQARGRTVQRADGADGGASMLSHPAHEHIPRKVAALARGFEARAGTSPTKIPDSGTVTPRRAAGAAVQRTLSPVVNYERYGMGGNSSGKAVWPPFLIAPERKPSPRPGSSEPRQVEPEVDTASAGPHVVRALSFRGKALETTPQAAADVQSSAVDVPPRPLSTHPGAPAQPECGVTKPGLTERKLQADADADRVRSAAPEPPSATVKAPLRPPAALPPADTSQPVKLAGLARAPVKAFGSPFKQREPAVDQTHDTDSMSMSCNVNMASPTGQAGVHAASFELQSKPPKEQSSSMTQALADPRKAAAVDRAKKVMQAQEVAAGPSALQRDPLDTDLRIATPPAAQNGGSLLMQRVSDAATSPVDSFWVRLFLGLSLQVHACIALTVGSHWLQSV